ncbi:MAG: hypothetical protein WCO02_10335 [Bacteroidota bacterium]
MKYITIKKWSKYLFVLILVFFAPLFTALADPPSPPDPGGSPVSGGGTPVGAPIDGGLGILLAMGAAYGGRKYVKARIDKKRKLNLESELCDADPK